jgi:hypothetical protein
MNGARAQIDTDVRRLECRTAPTTVNRRTGKEITARRPRWSRRIFKLKIGAQWLCCHAGAAIAVLGMGRHRAEAAEERGFGGEVLGGRRALEPLSQRPLWRVAQEALRQAE